jgi:hypothetical protein
MNRRTKRNNTRRKSRRNKSIKKKGGAHLHPDGTPFTVWDYLPRNETALERSLRTVAQSEKFESKLVAPMEWYKVESDNRLTLIKSERDVYLTQDYMVYDKSKLIVELSNIKSVSEYQNNSFYLVLKNGSRLFFEITSQPQSQQETNFNESSKTWVSNINELIMKLKK